jgi:tetratricopeptide (TPR) repeat protein
MSKICPATDNEIQRLFRFFRNHKDVFAIGFARGPVGVHRSTVLRDVEKELAELGIHLKTLDFSGQEIMSLYDYLIHIDEAPLVHDGPLAILGLESAIFGETGDRFLRILNLDRDRFRRNITYPMLLWLTPAAADKLQAEAHDFYDYWTGLFDFEMNESGKETILAMQVPDETAFVAPRIPDEAEKQYLLDEIARHEVIFDSLWPLTDTADERSRRRVIDTLRILARAKGRLGRIDDAKNHIAKMLTVMLPLPQKDSKPNDNAPETLSDDDTRTAIQDYAEYARWLNDQLKHHNATLAMALITDQKDTLIDAAMSAVIWQMYDAAKELIQLLEEFWSADGRYAEIESLTTGIQHLLISPSGQPPTPDSEAGILWARMEIVRVNQWCNADRLDEAEEVYLKLLETLEASRSSRTKEVLAVVYSQLGSVAEKRGDSDSDEAWMRKAISIAESLEDQSHLAVYYNNLSQSFSARGHLDEAERWLKRAMHIDEAQGDRSRLAIRYNNLSRLEQARGRLYEAEQWLNKAIDIAEEKGDRPRLAVFYNNKSLVERDRDRLDEAERWLKRAIDIETELGNTSGLATLYNNMGVFDLDRGRLVEAERWLTKGIDLAEQLEARTHLADFYNNLGQMYVAHGRFDEAAGWLSKAIDLGKKQGNRPNLVIFYNNKSHVEKMRGQLDEAEQLLKKAWIAVADLPNSRTRQEVGTAYMQMLFSRNKVLEAEAVRTQLDFSMRNEQE